MTVGIVDLLEVVEVEQNQRAEFVGHLRDFELPLQFTVEGVTICQPGEGVTARLVFDDHAVFEAGEKALDHIPGRCKAESIEKGRGVATRMGTTAVNKATRREVT